MFDFSIFCQKYKSSKKRQKRVKKLTQKWSNFIHFFVQKSVQKTCRFWHQKVSKKVTKKRQKSDQILKMEFMPKSLTFARKHPLFDEMSKMSKFLSVFAPRDLPGTPRLIFRMWFPIVEYYSQRCLFEKKFWPENTKVSLWILIYNIVAWNFFRDFWHSSISSVLPPPRGGVFVVTKWIKNGVNFRSILRSQKHSKKGGQKNISFCPKIEKKDPNPNFKNFCQTCWSHVIKMKK